MDNAMTLETTRTRFIGRTADGDRVHITVRLEPFTRECETVEHETISAGERLAITGIIHAKHSSHPHAVGQIVDTLREITRPASGLTLEDVREIADIWDAWHLHDTRAGCAHQTAVYEMGRYGRQVSLNDTPPCPLSGYRYGHAWLYAPIPADVLARLAALLDAAPVSS